MNLKEIRNAMFAQADWAPTQSSEAISRANSFINRAYNQLALEAPFLFFESKVHLATEPDVESKAGKEGVAGDRVQLAGANTLPGAPATKDPWTWRTTYTQTQQAANADELTAWKYDRSWDGRMIEITLADGTKIRNQIRSVWLSATDSHYYFTLATPWDIQNGSGTATIDGFVGFKYRIFTEAYALPDDLIQLSTARLRDNTNNYPLDVFGQRESEDLQLDGPPSQVASGIPRVIFRRSHVHMRGPSSAPVASPALTNPNVFDSKNIPDLKKPGSSDITREQAKRRGEVNIDPSAGSHTGPDLASDAGATAIDNKWLGPEPAGTFEYRVTYSWGKRDVEFQLPGLGSWEGFAQPLTIDSTTQFPSASTSASGGNPSRNRFRTPRFESPPSPVSNAMTVARVGDEFAAIKLSLPNITYALGFLTKFGSHSRQSLDQSGVYIRIYRRRIDANMNDYGLLENAADGLQQSQLDSDNAFYLLSEFRADSNNSGVWYDNGEFLPDYSRRLRDIHGYQTIQFYPKPDQRYVVDIRGVIRPEELTADQDVPLVHAEATNVLIEKAMVYLYENMGQTARSDYSTARYQELLFTLTKRYGDLRPPSAPVLRTMTRATGIRTNRRWNRRLSSDDLGGVVDG